jgi:hypothetical protein
MNEKCICYKILIWFFLTLRNTNKKQKADFIKIFQGTFVLFYLQTVTVKKDLSIFFEKILVVFMFCFQSFYVELVRRVGFSHGLWPWKYVREGGAINLWKICKWQERHDTNE